MSQEEVMLECIPRNPVLFPDCYQMAQVMTRFNPPSVFHFTQAKQHGELFL